MFIRFDRMYERDGHTHTQRDTHTPHRPRFHSIVRQKNVEQTLLLLLRYTFITACNCSVVLGVTLKLLVINISPSFLTINKLRRLLVYQRSVTTYG